MSVVISHGFAQKPKSSSNPPIVEQRIIDPVMKELNDIMIINYNESISSNVVKDYQIKPYINIINDYEPRLIIITTQKSAVGSLNFQTIFQKYLFNESRSYGFPKCEYPYRLLTKIDSMRKTDSGFKGGILSTTTMGFSYNSSLRTRIYYNANKVYLNFQNNSLKEKSSFTKNNKSFENHYNSDTKSKKLNLKYNGICIERYYMKRYTPKDYPRSGYGRISVGIQLKLPDNDQLYTLIVSNYNYIGLTNTQLFNNTNHKALNQNNYFKNRDDKTYAILLSPQKISIYPSLGSSEDSYGLNNQKTRSINNDLKIYVYNFK